MWLAVGWALKIQLWVKHRLCACHCHRHQECYQWVKQSFLPSWNSHGWENSHQASKTQSRSHWIWYVRWRKIKQESEGGRPGGEGRWDIHMGGQGRPHWKSDMWRAYWNAGGAPCRHPGPQCPLSSPPAFVKQHLWGAMLIEHILCAEYILYRSSVHPYIPGGHC